MQASFGVRSGRPQSGMRWLLSSQLGWQHRQRTVWNRLPKIASLRELIIMGSYPTTLPRVGRVWQHDLETVGCMGLVKSVGMAAEGKGVLVLRYSKGTKDTSTTASPNETHWEGGHVKFILHLTSKSVVHSRTKIRLFHCNTWME